MKAITYVSAFLTMASVALFASPASAQLDLPRPSPFAKVSQHVGLTEITVDYSSPGVKKRVIWGGLVPYDKPWRTGANSSTKITFSRDVTFGGKPVPAGTYNFLTIPGKKDWTIILNKDLDLGGDMDSYKQDKDVVRVQVTPKAIPLRERMTFLFSDFTDDTASLDLEWEKLRVSVPLKVATGEQALAAIKGAVDNGGWRMYASAARYFLDHKDYDSGLKYVEQSLLLKEDWYNVFTKAQLLAGKGNTKDAIPLAEKANEMGSKNPKAFFFAEEVKKSLADWKKKK